MVITENKTSIYCRRTCNIFYYCGLPNLWTDETKTALYHNVFRKIVTILMFIFIFSEYMSLHTQTKLTQKQASDRIVFCFSHPILFSYYFNTLYYKTCLTHLINTLTISLKIHYNDIDIEETTIRKIIFNSAAFLSFIALALASYGFDGIQQTLRKDGTFTTVVTAWPEVTDLSLRATVLRVVFYLIWWAFMIRASAVYVLVITITILTAQQFKNLQSYFKNLNMLFEGSDGSNEDDQEQRERLYEKSLKLGFQLHADTLWCVQQCQLTCSAVFSGQILINITVLCLLMLQMANSERTLMNALAIVSTAAAVLCSTGFLMWNAGDVTVEASRVPTAMFDSGWQHCRGAAAPRLGSMLVMAISQAQKPVEIHSFGVLALSYQSYLSIVKWSYSVFSLVY